MKIPIYHKSKIIDYLLIDFVGRFDDIEIANQKAIEKRKELGFLTNVQPN